MFNGPVFLSVSETTQKGRETPQCLFLLAEGNTLLSVLLIPT